jgi:hypothetical protein
MSEMKRFLLALAVVSGLAVSALPARADSLSDFIGIPTTISDPPLTFTGRQGTLNVILSGGATFNAANVAVTADGKPGLSYQSSEFHVSSGQSIDVKFEYVVHTSGPLIEDNSMTIQSGAISGTGNITITESVFADAAHTTPLANTLVAIFDGTNKNFDQKFFTPTSGPVYVVKDISLTGGSNGIAAFSNMTQDFSLAVPEPSTIAMALAGVPVLAVVWARRRRKV